MANNMNCGFLISYDWVPALRSLSPEDGMALLFALIDRQRYNIPIPEFENELVNVFAGMIEPTIIRRLNGQSGGVKSARSETNKDTTKAPAMDTTQVPMQASKVNKSKVNNNTLSDERVTHARIKKPKKEFIPPTIEEIREYCRERSNKIDPEKFYNHYTANGWMVGKNPMKDWKAAVRNWEKSEGTFAQGMERGNGVSTNGSFQTDEFFRAALAKSYGHSQEEN